MVVYSLAALWRVRPFALGLVVAALAPVAVLAWWLSIAPSNDRDWLEDVSRTPRFTLDGDRLTAHDVRDFHYRSDEDYDARWVTRTYDLSQLVGVDIFYSFWGPTLIAHTIMSWEFADGQHLAVSIETRKEKGRDLLGGAGASSASSRSSTSWPRSATSSACVRAYAASSSGSTGSATAPRSRATC